MSPPDWNFLPPPPKYSIKRSLQSQAGAPRGRRGPLRGWKIGNGDVAVRMGTHHYLPEALGITTGPARSGGSCGEKKRRRRRGGRGGRDFLAGIIENRSDSCTV